MKYSRLDRLAQQGYITQWRYLAFASQNVGNKSFFFTTNFAKHVFATGW